jgi:FKBP-type peptidyl-prolyl cis-trans isomerase
MGQVRDMFGDGGLIKRRIRDGTGEFPIDCPLQDSVMCIHYKGMLLEGGKIFYNTRTDNPGGEPLEFASGEGAVRGYAFHFELYLGILLN